MQLDVIHNQNCIEGMRSLPSESVDLVFADPPFGIDFGPKRTNYNRNAANVLTGYHEVSAEDYYDFTAAWLTEAVRVLKSDGSIYIVSGWTNLKDVLIVIDELGLHTLNHIIWKYQFGVYTRRKFVTSHYHILLCTKNPKRWTFNKIDRYPEDVWIINRPYRTGKIKTPTMLPEALVERAILYSSNPGEIVLDPFMGSGTTALAAKKNGRHYIGFEIVPEYVAFANKRIAELT